jgi:hypothetical protein
MNNLTIRVGFSASGALISRIIRFFTHARVSHTFLIVDDPLLGIVVIEAAWAGYRVTTFKRFQAKNTIVQIVTPTCSLAVGLHDAAEDLGERYDFAGLFGMVFVLLGRWLHRQWKNPLASPRALFCSEINTIVLQKSGYPDANTLIARDTSPQDLLEFLTKESPR